MVVVLVAGGGASRKFGLVGGERGRDDILSPYVISKQRIQKNHLKHITYSI